MPDRPADLAQQASATLRDYITRYIADGFRDEDGIWHLGPHRRAALDALDALASVVETQEVLERERKRLDLSEYEIVAAELAAARRALREIDTYRNHGHPQDAYAAVKRIARAALADELPAAVPAEEGAAAPWDGVRERPDWP